MLDRAARFAERHKRLLGVSGFVWLMLSSASYARFVTLPDIPFVTDEMALYASAAYNAGWWGLVRPQIERRRRLLAQSELGE